MSDSRRVLQLAYWKLVKSVLRDHPRLRYAGTLRLGYACRLPLFVVDCNVQRSNPRRPA